MTHSGVRGEGGGLFRATALLTGYLLTVLMNEVRYDRTASMTCVFLWFCSGVYVFGEICAVE